MKYQPYYCEENVWHLCAERSNGWAVFITNNLGQVLLIGQRLNPSGLVWDYHVVYLDPDGNVWDHDSTRFSQSLNDWLSCCFPPVDTDYSPRFRIVAAQDMVRNFASDRRHMRTSEGWLQPPPDWPSIGVGHTLDTFLQVDETWLSSQDVRAWGDKNVI